VIHHLKLFTVFLALLFFALVAPFPAFSQSDFYAEELVDRSDELRLYEERTWEVLLHYAQSYSGGFGSKIDDERFFLSPAGRTDRKSELEATIRSLFIPPAKDGEHVACRFPARYEWLMERLKIKSYLLPAFTCSERDKSLGAVEAKSAVLVFPVGHVNSPASMFGHTLIRIDGSSKSNLISYAANYSANTTDTNGFIYAWKGLTGMYKGYYSMMPYYLKVKEYNELEHRDMWEYRLNLSAAEVKKMLNHIWELQNIHSSYYFIDENCSYSLLFLVEAARPELRLIEKTGVFVLPAHTVQILMESGIVEDVHYRPSQGTKIRKTMALLDSDGLNLAHAIAFSSVPPAIIRTVAVSDNNKMKILDLSASYAQFRYARKEMEKDPYTRLYLAILSERSRLGLSSVDTDTINEPPRPEVGHGTTKISMGGGVRNGEAFAELNLRPEFHGLIDPDQGYLRGAQIKFLDTAVRYNFAAETFQLKTLHIVDILSIAPRDQFFTPISWKVNTGFDTEAMGNGEDYLIYRLNTGGGFSYASPFGGILYALGEVDINAGGKIRGKVTIGPGFSIGGVEQITDWWKIHLQARGMWYELGDDRQVLKASVTQNFRLTRNNSFTLDCSEERVNSHHIAEVSLFWNYYY
jgi:hypothetical protein